MPIERPDWSTPTGTTPANAEQPAAGEADENDSDHAMIRSGLLNVDELEKVTGRSAEEIEAIARPRTSSPSRQSIDAEIAGIERLMRADRRGYFRDEALQARHLELIAAREKLPSRASNSGVTPGDPVGLDPDLLNEWSSQGGVAHHLQTVQATAEAALDALEPEDQAALQSGFDALPASLQTEVFRHLSVTPSGMARPASDAAVAAFRETEEGNELVAEWGSQASRKLGLAQSRIATVMGSMSEADRAAAQSWFDGLPSAQARAVIRALAG